MTSKVENIFESIHVELNCYKLVTLKYIQKRFLGLTLLMPFEFMILFSE